MTFDGSTAFAVTTLGVALIVVLYVWLALGLAAVFRKSGEQGWKAWVPILNLVVLLRLGGLSGWLLLLGLVPIAGLIAVWVVVVIACHRIGASFGCGPGMTVLAAVLLPAWASVIGFGSSRWVGAEEQAVVRRTTADAAPTPVAGARRTPAAGEDDAEEFLAAVSESSQSSGVFDPTTPSAPYGRAPAAAAVQPPRPTVPAGWVPPPLPTPSAAGGPVAASDVPPIPPVPPGGAVRDGPWQGLTDADEYTDEVTGAVSGAPAPISAIPVMRSQADGESVPGPMRRSESSRTGAPEGTVPPVTRVPAANHAPETEPWAPARSPMSDPDAFPESSGEVSAIAGAPAAGSPRAASSSVSAIRSVPEGGASASRGFGAETDQEPQTPQDGMDETIITQRRRARWAIIPPSGSEVALRADVVILGRRPVADAAFPGAQLVAIQDGTVSKIHARLQLRDDTWYITDLDSTNGVLFATLMGTEVEAPPGVEVEAGGRFLLGDAEVRLVRGDA